MGYPGINGGVNPETEIPGCQALLGKFCLRPPGQNYMQEVGTVGSSVVEEDGAAENHAQQMRQVRWRSWGNRAKTLMLGGIGGKRRRGRQYFF